MNSKAEYAAKCIAFVENMAMAGILEGQDDLQDYIEAANELVTKHRPPEVPADLKAMHQMIVDCDGAEIHRDDWPDAERLVASGHITLGGARGPDRSFRRAVPKRGN
jgi:hypothetical protein